MGKLRATAAGVAAAGFVAVLLAASAGCGNGSPVSTVSAGPQPEQRTGQPVGDGDQPLDTSIAYAAEITGVSPGADPYTVLIAVTGSNGDGCFGPPQVTLLEESPQTIFADVLVSYSGRAVGGRCPEGTHVAALTSTAVIGDRALTLNQQAWALRAGAYQRCDPEVGCSPPADHCAGSWVLQGFNSLDVPRHAARNIRYCDQRWLVLDVDVNSAACGAQGRPGCSAPPRVTRYVLRFGTAWAMVAVTATAGCDGILTRVPDFPHAACEHLPAVR